MPRIGRGVPNRTGSGQHPTLLTRPWPPQATVSSATLVADSTRATGTGTTTATVTVTCAASTLVVAFVTWDKAVNIAGSATMSGGSLTWLPVVRSITEGAALGGGAEIHIAPSAAGLTSQVLTATVSSSLATALTIVTFTGADLGAVGTFAQQNNTAAGLFSQVLTTTRAGSWLWAVVYNFDTATSGTAGAGQTIARSYTDGSGDAGWVQSTTAVTAAIGTAVTINDTAPSTHGHMAVLEILPAFSAGVAAENVALTLAGQDATTGVAASAVDAGWTAAAQDPAAGLGAATESVAAALAAQDATTTLAAAASESAWTAAAQDPGPALLVNAEAATWSVAANDATVSTATVTNAPAEAATWTLTAGDATTTVQANAESAATTTAAQDPVAGVGAGPAAASLTTAAQDSAGSVGAAPTTAASTIAGQDASSTVAPAAEVAPWTGVAPDPTVQVGGNTNAQAECATWTATASDAAGAVGPAPTSAAWVLVGSDAAVALAASAEAAALTLLVTDPTIPLPFTVGALGTGSAPTSTLAATTTGTAGISGSTQRTGGPG